MTTTIKEYKIKKFYESDIINLKLYPDDSVQEFFKIRTRNYLFDLSEITSAKAKTELKNIIKYVITTNPKLNLALINYDLRPLFYLCLYVKEKSTESICNIAEMDFNSYMEEHGITLNRNMKIALTRLRKYELMEREKDLGLNKTIITYKDCNLSDMRINLTAEQDSMDFSTIANEANRGLLRVYIIYLIELTAISYTTIVQKFRILRAFLLHLGNTNLGSLTFESIKNFVNKAYEEDFSASRINNYFQAIDDFLNYLYIKELIPNTYNLKQFKVKSDYNYVLNRVDEEVLLQIFKVLHKLENPYRLMFLILYSTAMRVSEVCELPTSCLYKLTKDGKEHYCLRYKSEKMHDKSQMNEISQALYEMIESYIKEERTSNSKYLFPAIRDENNPFKTDTCVENIKEFFVANNVKKPDGTPYLFTPHSYRHELSSSLIDDDVPIFVVQEVCHHMSIEMTLKYAEISKKHKHQKYINYITKNGELDTILKEDCVGNDAELLSNGLCANPLHNCSKINKCLDCEHFRTDISHLEQFRKYRDDLKESLIYYEANNYQNQAATAKKTIEKVSVIIEALEKTLKED